MPSFTASFWPMDTQRKIRGDYNGRHDQPPPNHIATRAEQKLLHAAPSLVRLQDG